MDLKTLAIAAAALSMGTVAHAQIAEVLPAVFDASQRRALSEVTSISKVRVDKNGIPTRIEARLGTIRSAAGNADRDANAILGNIRKVLRGGGSESLTLKKLTRNNSSGMQHFRMQQQIAGIPVIGGELILHVEATNGTVTAIDSQFLPGRNLPRSPRISVDEAASSAIRQLNTRSAEIIGAPTLSYFRSAEANGYLVWVSRIRFYDQNNNFRLEDVLVDAVTARVVARHPKLYDALNRFVRDYSTGALLLSEGGSSGDYAAQMAYNYSGATYSYFLNRFGRDSWDGAGAPMQIRVHGTSYGQNNAEFNPSTLATAFGNGDGINFGLWTVADVVGHEWTHAITHDEAGLIYSGESGALNESMSDIFGAAVEASLSGVTTETWLFGEATFTPSTTGDALRYMANPTTDGRSRDFYPEMSPSDDVHYSSGIGNLAFYLLVNGGSHPRGRTSTVVNGLGIENATTIFYWALVNYLQSNHGYVQARNQTASAAIEHFGAESFQYFQTCAAWDAVGVPDDGSVCPAPPIAPTISRLGAVRDQTMTWPPISNATSYNVYFVNGTLLSTISTTTTSVAAYPCEMEDFYVTACGVYGCSGPSNSLHLNRVGNCD